MKTTPFERLVEHEIDRIKSIVASNEIAQQAMYRYPNQFARYTMILKRFGKSRKSLSFFRFPAFASFF